MKNDKWLLGVIIFLSSCSNNMLQMEESSLDALGEESTVIVEEKKMLAIQKDSISLFNTDNSGNTIFYPSQTFSIEHESYYVHDEVVINVPRLGREYVYNTEGKFPNLPKYNLKINTGCYIKYRIHPNGDGDDHNWYYYHPDTIKYTKPYYIEVPNYHPDDYRLLKVRLNAARLPQKAFDIQGILIGDATFQGKSVITKTEWLPENWSYDPWTENYNGFISHGNGDENQDKQIVDVRAQLNFSVTIHIDRNESGIYELKFGNQIVRKPYTKGESFITHTFTEELFFKAYLNSQYSIKKGFEGKDYDFNFYISPGYRGEILYAFAEAYKYN